MNKSTQHYTDEETGISYTLSPDGYYLPDLILPDEPEYDIGRFGLMRRDYLKNHRRILFINLLTTCKLNEHLYEIDQAANERFELISRQMAQTEGVTEELKSKNQMLWVQKMNGIRNRVEEMIRDELIYA